MAEAWYKKAEDRKEVPEAHPPAPSLLQTSSSPPLRDACPEGYEGVLEVRGCLLFQKDMPYS